MIPNAEVRERRERIVREHMESENDQDFERTIATFSHPRYELIPTGAVHDGEEAVREYFRAGRALIPDQHNELIALHHADDGVIVEFWLRGTYVGDPSEPAPAGRAFECRMTALFLFDEASDHSPGNGIVCERVYWDRSTIREQLLNGAR